jgi:hypothetical protein
MTKETNEIGSAMVMTIVLSMIGSSALLGWTGFGFICLFWASFFASGAILKCIEGRNK